MPLNAPISDMVKYVAFQVGEPERHQAYDSILDRSSRDDRQGFNFERVTGASPTHELAWSIL